MQKSTLYVLYIEILVSIPLEGVTLYYISIINQISHEMNKKRINNMGLKCTVGGGGCHSVELNTVHAKQLESNPNCSTALTLVVTQTTH